MDAEDLNEMYDAATSYFEMQGFTKREAFQMAMVWMYNETGDAPRGLYGLVQLEAAQRATSDIAMKDFDEGLVRYIETHTDLESHRRRDESTRGPSRRRSDEPPRGLSRGHSDKPARPKRSSTEYDRMFQNGGDKHAARTSGKILSEEDIDAKFHDIYRDLLAQGKHPDYARQKAEQFNIREMGKRNAARQGGGGRRSQSTRSQHGGRGNSHSLDEDGEFEDDEPIQTYDEEYPRRSKASRRGRGNHSYDAGADASYKTRRAYTMEELKNITKQLHDDCIEQGMHPEDARQEAKKWYQRHCNKQEPSSRPSAFGNSAGTRDVFEDEKGHGRRSFKPESKGSTRGPRTGARSSPGWGREDPGWTQYFTDEPEDFHSSSRSGTKDSGRGYRTEERRPSGRPPPSPEFSGVEPSEDLYEVLGVPKSATEAEIKSAHRQLCIKHHPDRLKGGAAAKKAATEKMAQINQACDVLMDGKLRAYYDRTGMIASMGDAPDA